MRPAKMQEEIELTQLYKNMATIDDFQKLDVRVGKIIEVNDFSEAKKPAYKLRIDFGSLNPEGPPFEVLLFKKGARA